MKRMKRKAVSFKIIPYGHHDDENAIILECEDGTKVIVPQKLVEEIVKCWDEI
jgi:hypothetical protein